MPDQNDIDRVWDIIEINSIGMLMTQFAGGLRARPVDAPPDRNAGAIYFVTDVRGHKDDEIAAKPDVCFVVVVPKDNVFLSITGRATVARDPAKARDIWKTADDMGWKGGPDDPNARVLRIEPVTADAAPIVMGETAKDLGAAVAVQLVQALGGEVALDRARLTVTLPS